MIIIRKSATLFRSISFSLEVWLREKDKMCTTLSPFHVLHLWLRLRSERVHCYWVGFYSNIFTLYGTIPFPYALALASHPILSILVQWHALNLCHVEGFDSGSFNSGVNSLPILLNVYLFVCCRLPMKRVGMQAG